MSSDLVHASPDDVRKLAAALERYERDVLAITKQAKTAIDRANWHDPQKDRFVARFNDFQKRTNSFMGGEVRQMSRGLRKLAEHLDRARNMRI